MPGIVGIITRRPKEWAEPQLRAMLESMRHESFYTAGTWMDESLGGYVGWIARENSFSDGMPLYDEKEGVALVFSGEEFPEPSSLEGARNGGNAKGAHLLQAYRRDSSFPASLNGTFHGIVIDRKRGSATL